MREKSRDQNNNWRYIRIGFRVSENENERINWLIKLSGLTKQDYIIKRLECRDIVVVGNLKVYSKLKNLLMEIYEKLVDIDMKNSIPDDNLREIIATVAEVLGEMKREGRDYND